MSIKFDRPIAIVDVETTGCSPAHDRIIEIGILRADPGAELRRYSSLICPGRHVSPYILDLTGITLEELDGAPPFEICAREIYELLEDALFIAHNVRFDYSFVRYEMARSGISFSSKTLCSALFSRKLYPAYRKHDLSSLIDRFGLEVRSRHRALDDAQAVWDFFSSAYGEMTETFFQVFEALVSRPALQTKLPQGKIEALPESPGVYLFYGEDGKIIYIGKSLNLRERVRSHFQLSRLNQRQVTMTGETADIGIIEAAGEFSALILEMELIKKHQPFFNRKLKRKGEVVYAVREENKDGYYTVTLTHTPEADGTERFLAVYSGERRAKEKLREIAGAAGLCLRFLGLEKTKRACFNYHIKLCLGACAGEEIPQTYNERLMKAFGDLKPDPWPFTGAVLLEEHSPLNEMKQGFLVNEWKILSRISYDGEGETVEAFGGQFDFYTYHLIRRAVAGGFKSVSVKPLPPAVSVSEETLLEDTLPEDSDPVISFD